MLKKLSYRLLTPMTLKQELGQRAEEAACQYLCQQGLHLIMRNYLCKMGEIDLVMRDKANLVFVEVRYRKPSGYGSAAETVTAPKQRKLIKAAMHYLQRSPLALPCRFDVVGITPRMNETLNIEWIKDAFRVEY